MKTKTHLKKETNNPNHPVLKCEIAIGESADGQHVAWMETFGKLHRDTIELFKTEKEAKSQYDKWLKYKTGQGFKIY